MPPQLIVGLYPDTLVETEITWIEVQPRAEHPMVEHPEMDQPEIVQAMPEQSLVEEPMNAPSLNEQPIIVHQETEQRIKIEQQTFDFQGKNRKHILILTASDKAQYLPEHELKFLISVLKACGLTTEDVVILNLKNQNADFKGLQSFFQNQTALLFGLEPDSIGLPMNFPQFQLQNFSKCTYLHAPALHEIEKDKALKMKLWGSLKNLFSL